MKDALIEFTMDGRRFCTTVPAESFADAERRIAAIRMTGKVAGWPCYAVRAPGPLASLALPFVALWCWLANFFGWRPK